MFVVLVTGPPGAGKTAALMALSDALAVDEIAHAAVDVDELAWAYPYPDDDRRAELLGVCARAHRADGHELLLVAELVESPRHLSLLLGQAGADDHLLVRLDARVDVLQSRIAEREPPGWSGLEYLLGEAERTQAALAELEGAHLVLSSEELGPGAIAARIRAARPDLLGPRAAG